MRYSLKIIPLKHIQICPHLCIIFSNLTVVQKGCNNKLSNTMAYILLLNYVWHTSNYLLECSMRGQFRGYFTFLLWFRSCDSQACIQLARNNVEHCQSRPDCICSMTTGSDLAAIVFIQPGMQEMSIIICAFKVSVDWYWSWPRQSYL